jgi:hypothetical protein
MFPDLGGGVVDISLASAQSACGSAHPAVGRSLELTRRSHRVGGTATIVDDCTIRIEGFTYDGGGREVRVYGGIAGDYENGPSLSEDLFGTPFDGEALELRLPAGVDLDDFDGLSIWCVPVGASFGHGTFQ